MKTPEEQIKELQDLNAALADTFDYLHGLTPTQAAELRKDAARLDWLERHPRHAQILIEGKSTDCVFYGVSCAKLSRLREVIDTVMGS